MNGLVPNEEAIERSVRRSGRVRKQVVRVGFVSNYESLISGNLEEEEDDNERLVAVDSEEDDDDGDESLVATSKEEQESDFASDSVSEESASEYEEESEIDSEDIEDDEWSITDDSVSEHSTSKYEEESEIDFEDEEEDGWSITDDSLSEHSTSKYEEESEIGSEDEEENEVSITDDSDEIDSQTRPSRGDDSNGLNCLETNDTTTFVSASSSRSSPSSSPSSSPNERPLISSGSFDAIATSNVNGIAIDISNVDASDSVVEIPRVDSRDSSDVAHMTRFAHTTSADDTTNIAMVDAAVDAAIPETIQVRFVGVNKFAKKKNGSTKKVFEISYSTNVDDIFDKVCKKAKLDDASLPGVVKDDETRKKLETFRSKFLKNAIKKLRDNWLMANDKPECKLKYRVEDKSGVYGLEYVSGIKYGMSFNVVDRIRAQSAKHLYAFKIANTSQLKTIIGEELVQQIEGLDLPGIYYDDDHRERGQGVILMQVFEVFLVAAHQPSPVCVTQTILERFVRDPPTFSAITPEEEEKLKEFFKDLHDGSVVAFTSWPHYGHWIEKYAAQHRRKYIGTRIFERGDENFVTLYLIKALFGRFFHSSVDVVDDPHKKKDYDTFLKIVAKYKLLEKRLDPQTDKKKIKILEDAFAKISGANRDSYVRPPDCELASGLIEKFEQYESDPTMKDKYFYVEHRTLEAARREGKEGENGVRDKSWVEENIEGGTNFTIGKKEDRLSFYITKNGRHIMVTPSYFHAFSPEKTATLTGRINSVRSEVKALQAVHGTQSPYIVPHIKKLTAYLMALEASDDDRAFRSEAKWAMPKAVYSDGPGPNCKTVSDHLDMCVWGHFYLLFQLEEDEFRNLLFWKKMLLPVDRGGDELQLWPSHYDWTCPGTPAYGSIEAQPCNNTNPEEETACMVGGENTLHPFGGTFVCRHCHRKMDRLWEAWLNQKVESGKQLTEEEREKLDKFQASSGTARRNAKKARDGEDVVLNNQRQNERQRTRKPRNPKSGTSGVRRAVTTKWKDHKYPKEFEDKLGKGVIEFFKRWPRNADKQYPWQIKYYDLQTLFGAILDKEWNRLWKCYPPKERDRRTSASTGSKTKWRTSRFEAVVSTYMTLLDEGSKVWILKEEYHDAVTKERVAKEGVNVEGEYLNNICKDIVEVLCPKDAKDGTKYTYPYKKRPKPKKKSKRSRVYGKKK